MTQQRQIRPFTGKKVAMIFIAFFGVVIAVNLTMARLATSTFGGLIVDDSYLAGQHFNSWLAEAKVEQTLGWKGELVRDPEGGVAMSVTGSDGKPMRAASVTAIAEHPLGQQPLTNLTLREIAPGTYAAPLLAGRWRVRVTVQSGGKVWRTVGEVL